MKTRRKLLWKEKRKATCQVFQDFVWSETLFVCESITYLIISNTSPANIIQTIVAQYGHICSFDIQPPTSHCTALHHVACWLNATHVSARDDLTCKQPKIWIFKSHRAKYRLFTLFNNFHENPLRNDESRFFFFFYRQRLILTRCGLSVTYKDLKRKRSPGLYSSFHFNGPGLEWVA